MSRVSSNASIPEGVAVSAGFLERSSIGSSVSMKGSRSNRGSLMEVSSSSMGLGIGIGTRALDMSKNLSSTPMSHLPTRPCQPLSAGSGVINSSPLVSAHTSSQALVSRPSDQRDLKRERTQPARPTTGMTHGPRAADKSANNHEIDERLQLMPATVAMTRCNSLPVLTLRELEAIQEKDGDLGIQRGGHWAWVSREVTVDEDGNEVYAQSFVFLFSRSLLITVDRIESVPQGTICTGSTTVIAPLRPSFTMFQDPFAGRPPSPSAQPYIPIATSSNYRYSPAHPSRRMSEMPSVASDAYSKEMNKDTRRPSMPVVLEVGRGSKGMPHPQALRSHLYSTIPLSSTLAQYQGPAPAQIQSSSTEGHTGPFLKQQELSAGDTILPSAPIQERPRLTRYKSSPARSNGLGLNIVLLPADGRVTEGSTSSPSHNDRGTERPRVPLGQESRRTSIAVVGHWAEVDFVDPLVAASDFPPVIVPVPLSTNASPTQYRPATPPSEYSSGVSPTALPHRDLSPSQSSTFASQGSIISTGSTHSAPAAASAHHHQINSFEVFSFGGRRERFESIDSALPLMPGGTGSRLSVPPTGAGEAYHSQRGMTVIGGELQHGSPNLAVGQGTEVGGGEGEIPRRGSLGMGTFARLRRVMGKGHLDFNDETAGESKKHWSERRGSWAEGWTKS